LACLVVPVLGNLLRAYFVVMLVHLTDGRLAGDHVLYGTLFFGAILLAMFVVGARYADHPEPAVAGLAPVAAGSGVAHVLPAAAAAAVVAMVTAVVPGELRERALSAEAGHFPTLPASVTGYLPPADGVRDWQPALRGAAGESLARYSAAGSGAPVDAFVAYFEPLSGKGELTDSRHKLFDGRAWRRVGGSPDGDYIEAVLRPAPRSSLPGGTARVVWSWYVVDGEATDSRLVAKLLEMRGLLGGGTSRQGIVALSVNSDAESDGARDDLRAFAPAFCASTGLPCPGALGRPVR
jgi:EpsI family protein